MMNYDVIIVGAGASGLICGLEAVRQGARVCILEHKEKAGKKLYATGNGKCNLGNEDMSMKRYHSMDASIQIAPSDFGDFIRFSREIEDYFMTLGVPVVKRQGYMYPRSEQASTVVQALVQNYMLAGGELFCNTIATAIEHTGDGYMIKTEAAERAAKQQKKQHAKQADGKQNIRQMKNIEIWTSKKLVLATGGMAGNHLGSDGSGYRLANMLSHTITSCVPALCGLHCSEAHWKKLQGIRAKGKVTIGNSKGQLGQEQGEIQFTNYGLSGIVIFNLSRYACRSLYSENTAKEKAPVQDIWVEIDFLPEYSMEEMLTQFAGHQNACGERELAAILHGYIPDKLAEYLLERAGLDAGQSICSLNYDELRYVIGIMKKLHIPITGVNDFAQAQVTAGGIPLSEVSLQTMESKRCKNLYLTGELLDIDADCGGYNLMWAWYSGYQAGIHCGR